VLHSDVTHITKNGYPLPWISRSAIPSPLIFYTCPLFHYVKLRETVKFMLRDAKNIPYKLDALQTAQRFKSHWLNRGGSNLSGTQVITTRSVLYGTLFWTTREWRRRTEQQFILFPSSSFPLSSKILLFFFFFIFVHCLKTFIASHYHYCSPHAVFPVLFLLNPL